MTSPIEFHGPPSVLAYMTRAVWPSPGLREGFPPLVTRWPGHRVDPAQLAEISSLTGLEPERAELLYPQLVGFRLVMAIVTAPRWPLPIWGALQIRNDLRQHAPLGPAVDLEVAVGEGRVLEKGVEVDLVATAKADGEVCWEGRTTFWYRGRYGVPADAPAEARAPDVPPDELATWTVPFTGWRAGKLTGDFNGVHLFDAWARRFGFARAFAHPPVVIGRALALVGPPSPPARLQTWLKGPVPYGSTVTVRGGGGTFGVYVGRDERPALVGRYS